MVLLSVARVHGWFVLVVLSPGVSDNVWVPSCSYSGVFWANATWLSQEILSEEAYSANEAAVLGYHRLHPAPNARASLGFQLTVCHMPWLMIGPLLVMRPTPLYRSCNSSRPARRPRTIQVLSERPPAKKRTPSGSKVRKSNSASSL